MTGKERDGEREETETKREYDSWERPREYKKEWEIGGEKVDTLVMKKTTTQKLINIIHRKEMTKGFITWIETHVVHFA